MNSSQKNARLKRVPVWPLWGGLAALVATSCVPSVFAVVPGIMVKMEVIGRRRTLLASIARLYPFKHIKSERIRKLICLSPFLFGFAWSLLIVGIAAWHIYRGHREDDLYLLGWILLGGIVAILFELIHLRNCRRASKQAAQEFFRERKVRV